MSRRKRAIDSAIDYKAFSNPYSGLAAMIFLQADWDLKMLNGEETKHSGGCLLDKWEIINFLRSPWAAVLAGGVGLDLSDLRRYEARVS